MSFSGRGIEAADTCQRRKDTDHNWKAARSHCSSPAPFPPDDHQMVAPGMTLVEGRYASVTDKE